MGYYTDYEIFPVKDNREPLSADQILAIQNFVEATKIDGWSYLSDVWYGRGTQLTWYEHQKDMIKLSAAFPDVLFTLWGCGQETDDQWKEYYLDGKCQVARGVITYPDFDEGQLKDLDKTCPVCYGKGVEHADGVPSIGCRKCWGTGETIGSLVTGKMAQSEEGNEQKWRKERLT